MTRTNLKPDCDSRNPRTLYENLPVEDLFRELDVLLHRAAPLHAVMAAIRGWQEEVGIYVREKQHLRSWLDEPMDTHDEYLDDDLEHLGYPGVLIRGVQNFLDKQGLPCTPRAIIELSAANLESLSALRGVGTKSLELIKEIRQHNSAWMRRYNAEDDAPVFKFPRKLQKFRDIAVKKERQR